MAMQIVAVGGTVRSNSSTEAALRVSCRPLKEAGAKVTFFGGEYLSSLPFYRGKDYKSNDGDEFVGAVRSADGILIAAPGYHGTVSGLVKNALDYLEDLSDDRRPYLHGRTVGLIATAYGDQAAMGTLSTLRCMTHALRGWPTPVGGTVKTYKGLFSPTGECLNDKMRAQLILVGKQVLGGAKAWSEARAA